MAHDKKLNQAIALAIDTIGAKTGHTTVREVRAQVQIVYPPRLWHPYDHREAENDYLGKQIKKRFAEPLSNEYIERELPHIRHKHRNLLADIPAWFFVRSKQEWIFSLSESAASLLELVTRTPAPTSGISVSHGVLR